MSVNFQTGSKGTTEERKAITGARQVLFEARERRVRPGRDEKVVTSWNGLMLAAFAEAARALERKDYLAVAQHNADFLLRELHDIDGHLWHVWNAEEAKVTGLLEDYASLIEGLLALYQADFDPRWYRAAKELADVMLESFSAETGFYDTAEGAEVLLLRPREVQDNAVPSGNAMAATVLLKLARLRGEAHYDDVARRSLASMQGLMGQHPLAFGQWLVALDSALATPVEVAVIGEAGAEDTQTLLAVAQQGYHPHRLIAAGTGNVPSLLAHREKVGDKATAYVCHGQTCHPPVTDPGKLAL